MVMPKIKPMLRGDAVAGAAEQSQFRDLAGSGIWATTHSKTHRSYGSSEVTATKHKLLMPLRQSAVTEKGLLGCAARESRRGANGEGGGGVGWRTGDRQADRSR
jgi:hypothetical protein